jgi:membrane protease subunit HflK
MTHSGAIAATMMAVASAPIRGRPTSSSCGVISIVVCRDFRQEARRRGPRRRWWWDRPPVQFNPKFLGGGIGLLLVLVVIVWLASGFYIVDASQRGLVLQFGRYKESTEPGLRWRLPYPIQAHELVNISGVRTLEIGYRGSEKNKVLKEALMLTDDENIINIQFAVQYILKDPVEYVFNNRNPDEAVMQVAETAIRQIVGKNKMDFVLYEGREQVAVNASQLMQEILDRYKTGILISKVTMQNAQPPEQVQAAFDDAVKASQDRERQKNEGQAYANDVIPKSPRYGLAPVRGGRGLQAACHRHGRG